MPFQKAGKSAGMTNAAVFWGEMAPCEHLVQIYEDDSIFLDTLESFVADGLLAGEGVVVIATSQHLSSLNRSLVKRDPRLARAMQGDQYLSLDAEAMLSLFMVNGWPDDALFNEFVTGILKRASDGGRRVRAFGEMVALLWAQGNCGATVRLEHLWHKLCEEQEFMLFCAYPKIGFTRDTQDSIQEICDTHSRVIA
jgi:hypothetical protein